MKEKLLTFFKKETILCIACLLAVLSACIVPPDAAYLGYVDTRVLILLFSLMAVLQAFARLASSTAWQICFWQGRKKCGSWR